MALFFSILYILAMAIIFLFMLIVYIGMPLIMLGGFVMEAIALRKELRQPLDNDKEENNDGSQGNSENNKEPSPYEWLAKAHNDESRSK